MSKFTDDELLDELQLDISAQRPGKHTALEERIIAGFEDIERFYETHNRLPQHGEGLDIFERIYAVRLDRLRSNEQAMRLLSAHDRFGLLAVQKQGMPVVRELRDEYLLAELGIDASEDSNITVLKHVSSREDRRAAEEIANRTICQDFDEFKPLFEAAEQDLQSGVRATRRFAGDINISQGEFFIVGGQVAYVAEKGPEFKTPNGEPDARLRLIYANGTETNLLMRSLQRALYKDEAGRRIVDARNLFSDEWEEGDITSGTIYVLRSHSDHPFIAQHRELIHKIGVTGGKVETRIANAKVEATYLLADVEVIATYKMAGINRSKLEHVIHRVFAPAQIDLVIQDRFGTDVQPKEWFLVPLSAIDEAIAHIRDGSITNFVYDPTSASLLPRAELG